MAAERSHDGILANWKCLLACFVIAMGPFQYGVDYGLIAGLQAMVGFLQVFGEQDPLSPTGWNIDTTRQQLIGSLMTLGACIGCAVVGPISTKFGRRQGVWLAVGLCFVANIIMITTTNIAALYVGRILIGIANGWFMTFPQLYLQEATPGHLRGFVYVFFQFWISLGSLIGTIVDNFTSKISGRESYQIPLGIIFIVPAILGTLIIFIPESPRWLLLKGRTEEARSALRWLRPNHEAIEAEILSVQTAHEIELEYASHRSWTDCFTNKVERRRTLLSLGALTLLSAPGAMYMIAYATYFFQMANIGQAFENSCIVAAMSVIGILSSSLYITRLGRRTILMFGMFISGIMQLIPAIAYDKDPLSQSTGRLIVACNIIYMFFYNGCLAAYAWLVTGELPSQRLRSVVFGIAGVVGFFWPWLSVFTAPYFINPDELNWGPKYGFIWFPAAMIATVWIFFFIPEVKDRTLEEIDEMFAAGLSARKFKGYKCTATTFGVTKENGEEKTGEVEVVELETRA